MTHKMNEIIKRQKKSKNNFMKVLRNITYRKSKSNNKTKNKNIKATKHLI